MLALTLAGLLLMVLAGVVLAALLVGDLEGMLTGEVGELPAWMSAWLVLFGAFLAVILGWSVWILAAWVAAWIVSRRVEHP